MITHRTDLLKLDITLDLSATVTKIFYSTNNPKIHGFLSQSSAVQTLANRYYFDEEQSKADNNTALVFANNEYWMVGAQAAKGQQTNPDIAKTNTVPAKVLSSVGQVLKAIAHETAQVDLRVALLLPLSESRVFNDTAKLLTKELQSYLFNAGQIDCNVISVECYVEGSGIAAVTKEPGSVIIMFGHRDVSILPVENGSIAASAKTLVGKGMIDYLSNLKSAGLDEIGLAIAVFNYIVFNKPAKLQAIAGRSFKQIEPSILPAKELIWARLLVEFQAIAALAQAENIVQVGGNAAFWKKELIQTYGVKQLSGTNLKLQKLIKSQHPNISDLLASRLTDVFALHNDLFNSQLWHHQENPILAPASK